MKNVLFILGNYRQGGAERQAVLLAQWLKQEKGYNVAFAAFSDRGVVCDELEALDIPWRSVQFDFYFINHFAKFSFSKSGVSHLLKLQKQIRAFADQIKDFAPDIVMPYTYYPNVVAGLSYRKAGAKICIWNQRDIGTEGFSKGYAELKAAEQISHFVANSTEGAEFIRSCFQVAPGKVSVIHNGIVVPGDKPLNFDFNGINRDGKNVLMLANFHSNKDHATLIRAWKIVIDKLKDSELRLVLAGRFGGTERKLMQDCIALGIRDHVVFLDSVRNVSALLQQCLFTVHSSFTEGNPNAVLEAMANGKAVVATDIRGNREALGENYEFFCEPGNPELMAAPITELIKDTSRAEKCGQRNKLRIENDFTVAKMGTAYLEIFSRLQKHN